MADPAALDRKHKLVIIASSLGTVFEWYDFYIYGTLAAFFGKLFFPPATRAPPTSRASPSSASGSRCGRSARWSSAGWATSPGSKYTFLITIIVMGLSTALVGLLPTYASIGFWRPSSCSCGWPRAWRSAASTAGR
jgi:hypothetical protein